MQNWDIKKFFKNNLTYELKFRIVLYLSSIYLIYNLFLSIREIEFELRYGFIFNLLFINEIILPIISVIALIYLFKSRFIGWLFYLIFIVDSITLIIIFGYQFYAYKFYENNILELIFYPSFKNNVLIFPIFILVIFFLFTKNTISYFKITKKRLMISYLTIFIWLILKCILFWLEIY